MSDLRRWDRLEDAFLIECTAIGISAGRIGKLLNRSRRGTAWRRQKLGLQVPPKPAAKVRPRQMTPVADIQAVVASHFELTIEQLKSPARTLGICRPRQIGMFLAHDVARSNYSEIGRRFGRDHTTVIHAVRQIERMCASDDKFASSVRELRAAVVDKSSQCVACELGAGA